jgi:hypothetical protein
MHTIALSLQRDDGSVELAVEVKGGCLAGRGSAWFDTAALSQFASDLEAMPLRGDQPPSISGGYWNQDASQLVQEHVHLSVRPVDQVGGLVLRLKVFTPASNPTYAEIGLGCGVAGDFLVSYEFLAQFAQAMRGLLAGSQKTIEFELVSLAGS